MITRLRTLAGIAFCAAAIGVTSPWLGLSSDSARARDEEPQFTTEFRLKDCQFKTEGVNPYFILKPDYQLLFEGEEDEGAVGLLITVLDETEKIFLPGLGGIRTRVVEEQHFVNEVLVEYSRNFFALCGKTNDVFYFGEEVDICEDGLVQVGDHFLCDGEDPSHAGAWRAGVGAAPGIIMPGTFLLGSRYFQEMAPNVAMDRAEHVEMGLTVTTEAGAFDKCVKIIETTPLEPRTGSIKTYCPRVGLVIDEPVELVEVGFDIVDDED